MVIIALNMSCSAIFIALFHINDQRQAIQGGKGTD